MDTHVTALTQRMTDLSAPTVQPASFMYLYFICKGFNTSSMWVCTRVYLCGPDVGGYFETGTLVRYDFLSDAGPPLQEEDKALPGGGVSGEANLTREELVFSFSTYSAPSILIYISSRTQDSMAVVLRHNGELFLKESFR